MQNRILQHKCPRPGLIPHHCPNRNPFDVPKEINFYFTPIGLPKEEILNTAKEWQADLIVMGTHGRTGLLHLVMGSVAEHIVRHATVPVLVVR
jgi:hypothetical protein